MRRFFLERKIFMYIELGYIYKGKKDGKDKCVRNVFGNADNFMDKYADIMQKCYNTNMYIGAYAHAEYPAKGKKLQPYKLYGDFYADIDVDGAAVDPEAYDTARREAINILGYIEANYCIPTNMMEIYYSGSKGFHIIAPFMEMGLQPHEQLNDIYHYVAQEIKNTVAPHIDTGIYDRKRILRAAGSINGKTGLYKVPVTYNQLCKFKLDDIKEWASKPHNLIVTVPKLKFKSRVLLECLKNSGKWLKVGCIMKLNS